MRVAGHELRREGAPYNKTGRSVFLANQGSWSVKGEGRGLCSCGWTSQVLPSAAKRKEAHRVHKQLIAEERAKGWNPERVRRALDLCMAGDVEVGQNSTGETTVSMEFPVLLALVDSICGSMSMCAPCTDAKGQLEHMLEQAEISAQIMAQAKRRKT